MNTPNVMTGEVGMKSATKALTSNKKQRGTEIMTDESRREVFRRRGGSMLKLAKQQRFSDIMRILQNYDAACIETWIYGYSNRNAALMMFKGETPLHHLMIYQPPAYLVDLVISKMKEIDPSLNPESAVDIQGRTALHMACAFGCDVAVIIRLLGGDAEGTSAVKDSSERCPLHWACANLPDADKKPGRRQAWDMDNMLWVVNALVKAFPKATTFKDKSGMTPADLARTNRADNRIISLLEKQMQGQAAAVAAAAAAAAPSGNSATQESSAQSEFPVPRQVAVDDDPIFREDDVSSVGSTGASLIWASNPFVGLRRLQKGFSQRMKV